VSISKAGRAVGHSLGFSFCFHETTFSRAEHSVAFIDMQNLGNWQADDGYAESVGSVDATSTRASHPQQLRSPLGQLIERSATSPIRTSMIEHATSGPFVGNVSQAILRVEVDAMTNLVLTLQCGR
jgi:hypothetical protein